VTSSALPLSARFALWFSAWAAGAVSLDDARDAIVGDDALTRRGYASDGTPVP